MKKLFLILLLGVCALSFLFVVVSCGDGSHTETTDEAAQTTQPFSMSGTPSDTSTPTSTAAPVPEVPSGKLTLAGQDIADYVILYAESEYKKLRPALQGTEYDFYKKTAEKIAAEIKTMTGVTLSVKSDATAETAYEILVGPTKRNESDIVKGLGIYDYVNQMLGTKLVIGGGTELYSYTGNLRTYYTYASTYHAFDALYDDLSNRLQQSDIDLADGFSLSGKRHFKTVACVGDSITEGIGSSDRNYTAYPAVLQRLMWQDHVIINFGNSGKTMRNDLGNNYTGTTQHAAFLKMLKDIDLTLVMLGTNDSHFDSGVWTADDDDRFCTAAYQLCRIMRTMNPDMKITVMNCPVYYGSGTSGSAHVRNLQAKLPEYLNDKGIDGVMLYDMHTFTAEYLGIGCFPDQLHPNDAGYGIMAGGLAEVIDEMLAGEYNCTIELVDEPSGEAPAVSIPHNAVNILGSDLETLYSLSSNHYYSWNMPGAPYLYMDLSVFEGYTVTNIEVPVSYVEKGQFFTVSVVKYTHPQITETLKKYYITADFSCERDYAAFGDLQIEVPVGYTLAFGAPGDTMPLLYIDSATPSYRFYGTGAASANNMTLAFNLYGIPAEGFEKPEDIPKAVDPASKNIFGRELDRDFPIATYSDWVYSGSPYLFMDFDLFEGKTITDIEMPIGSSPQNGRVTVLVIKWQNGIVETLSTHILTVKEATNRKWVLFSGLNITVPEGYTLAFGADADTARLTFFSQKVSGYEFYNKTGNENLNACLTFNIWGKETA